MSTLSFRKSKLNLLLLAALGGSAFSASATQTLLSYSSNSQVYGYISYQQSSAYLPGGNSVTSTGYGPSDYSYTNGIANATWSLPAGETTSDPFYNSATNSGVYSYSYTGSAQVLGNTLKASISSSSTDTNWSNPNGTSVQAYATASYTDLWLISADSKHAAGTYGAILVTEALDGRFPTNSGSGNSASVYLQSSSSFTDKSGVNYNSNFSISAYPSGSYSSGDSSWTYADWTNTQSKTVTKKLLFQYDTPFSLSMYLQSYSSSNGEADFLSTAKITDVLLPYGASLETGSLQSGITGVTFGNLHNATSLSDPNTNWDFGNGGGAIVPVPEPESYAMLLAGLGLVGYTVKRRKRA